MWCCGVLAKLTDAIQQVPEAVSRLEEALKSQENGSS